MEYEVNAKNNYFVKKNLKKSKISPKDNRNVKTKRVSKQQSNKYQFKKYFGN